MRARLSPTFALTSILAAMLPLDNYLADVNSGQSWYRPSYMLVAVLRNDRAAYAYQGDRKSVV